MQDAARGHENIRSINWKLTNLNGSVARDQVVEPTLAHRLRVMLWSEEIARVPLRAYLDTGSSTHIISSRTFEDPGSNWAQHYRVAEAYSDTLPAMLNNCLQIWAQPSEDERNRGRSDVFHRSPLHLCSALGFTGLGEVYLQMGKDPNVLAHPDGQTALHLASAGGHTGMIRKLLDRGADIEKTTFHTGRTALQIAAVGGHEDVVQLLLGGGADVDATDKLGHTALELAAQNGHEEIVELLMNNTGHNSAGLGWHEANACDNYTNQMQRWLVDCFLGCCRRGEGPNCCQCGDEPDSGHCGGQTKSGEADEEWIAVDRHKEV
jgi:Ankyrin repeats (3 copies)/Ankyrin repeat